MAPQQLYLSDAYAVKSIERVSTAFFPWSASVLVPGYCLSYQTVKKERKEGYEQEVKVDDDLIIDCETVEDSPAETEEIKVLKPYTGPDSPTLSKPNSPVCYDAIGEGFTRKSKIEDELMPLAYNKFQPNFNQSMDIRYQPQSVYNNIITNNNTPTLQHSFHASAFQDMRTFRKHQCEYCHKWFKRSSSLSNHRMIHKNDKTFKCNQCSMCFLRKSDLGKHMVIHSGSKPYECNVCGKRFSQSSNMLTHQRRHTGVRPYSCNICGKSFYRKVDVRRHASVHRGEA